MTPAPSLPSSAAPGYTPSAIRTSRKFTPAARTSMRTSPCLIAPVASVDSTSERLSSVFSSVACNRQFEASAGGIQGAVGPHLRKASGKHLAFAYCDLRLPRIHRPGEGVPRLALKIYVDEYEALGVLRLGRAQQSP